MIDFIAKHPHVMDSISVWLWTIKAVSVVMCGKEHGIVQYQLIHSWWLSTLHQWREGICKGHTPRLHTGESVNNSLHIQRYVLVDKEENQVVESLLTHGASKLGLDVAKSWVAAFYCGSGDRCYKQDGENPLDVGEGESACFQEGITSMCWW